MSPPYFIPERVGSALALPGLSTTRLQRSIISTRQPYVQRQWASQYSKKHSLGSYSYIFINPEQNANKSDKVKCGNTDISL